MESGTHSLLSLGPGIMRSGLADLLMKCNLGSSIGMAITDLCHRGVFCLERDHLEKAMKLWHDASFKPRTMELMDGTLVHLDMMTLCLTRNLLRAQGRSQHMSKVDEEITAQQDVNEMEWEAGSK